MRERYVLACALALVGALSSGLAAQRAKPAVSTDMTSSHCSAIVRLQSAAMETVTRAQTLAHARHVQHAAVQAQAEASHSDLQSLLKELDAAVSSANQQQKAVIASLLVHDRAADQHAAQLVDAVRKQPFQVSEIDTHATGEIQHLRQAETALKTDPNTGQATGQRGTVLCRAQSSGVALHKSPGRSHDALTVKQSARAGGKRQY